MGVVRSKLARAVKNYNVEYRAGKVLERRANPDAAAEPAPKHASTVEKIGSFRQENPQYMEAVQTKYEGLHNNLKSVYVESHGDNPEIQSSIQAREPSKLSNKFHEEQELGSMEVDYEVPEGKISLRSALEFMGKYQMDSQVNSTAVIAADYKLDQEDVQKVVTHFKVLGLHIPKEMYAKNRNMKKLVQEQIAHGQSFFTKDHLRIPSNSEIKEIKKKLKEIPDHNT